MSAPTWPNIPETIYIWTPNGTDWGILWPPFFVTEPVYEYHLAPAWVSVEDRLPEEHEKCLVLVFGKWQFSEVEKYHRMIAVYLGDKQWNTHHNVTHWMPLPSPPTGGDE